MHIKMKPDTDPVISSIRSELVNLIRNRLGIVMHTHQDYELTKTVREGCTRFKLSPFEYLAQLHRCENQSPLLEHLISGITVGETYFFRDRQQMLFLQNHLLPQLVTNKNQTHSCSIRIWSAGCSSGEEIYSIAMMLCEIIPDIKNWTLKLLATDINTVVLQKAIAGNYTEWSMRSIPDYFKNKYFNMSDRRYKLIQPIKEMVTFDYLNLNDDNYPSIFNGTNAQDLILFRNVLIYMDNESSIRFMGKINKSLVPGGYLMLGASDPVNTIDTDFIFHDRKIALLKRPLEKETVVIPVPDIKKQEIKIPVIKSNKTPIKLLQTPPVIKPNPVKKQDLTSRASDLANIGKLDEAIQLCEEGFRTDPTNKFNYFTYSLAMSELNKLAEAESALRKTLFLDNQFVAGHFQLGLLLLRKNQHDAGLKSLKNALSIAESQQAEDAVPGSSGLTYKHFADILRNEIMLHKENGA